MVALLRFVTIVALSTSLAVAWCLRFPEGWFRQALRRAHAPERPLSYHDRPAWIEHVTEALDVFPENLDDELPLPLADNVTWLHSHRARKAVAR